jgi:hypothetical protein
LVGGSNPSRGHQINIYAINVLRFYIDVISSQLISPIFFLLTAFDPVQPLMTVRWSAIENEQLRLFVHGLL